MFTSIKLIELLDTLQAVWSGVLPAISPTSGAELLTDPGVELWNDATTPTAPWSKAVAGTSTVNREGTIKHGGSFAARLDVDGSNSNVNIAQPVTAPAGSWIRALGWLRDDNGTSTCRLDITSNALPIGGQTLTASYSQYIYIGRITSPNPQIVFVRNSSANRLLYGDDFSAVVLDLPSLYSVRAMSSANGVFINHPTRPPFTQVGIVHYADASNQVVAFLDGGGNIRIDKNVAGLWSNVLSPVAVTYVAGAELALQRYGPAGAGKYLVIYNGAIVGSPVTIADTVFDTALQWGNFSTYGNNTFGAQSFFATQYLLFDDFSTPQSALIPTPLPCEPGPGQRNRDTDTAGHLSISGGKLITDGGVNFGDPSWYLRRSPSTSTWALAAGMAFASKHAHISGLRMYIGLGAASNHATSYAHAHTNSISTLAFQCETGSSSPTVANITPGATYETEIVFTGTRLLLFIRGNEFADWTLLFVHTPSTTPAVYFGGCVQTAAIQVDYQFIKDLGGAFATDYGLATLHQTSPANDTPYAGVADGITDLYFTLPGAPVAGDTAVLRYRYQAASDYWQAYVVRNAGNTAWDFVVESRENNSNTNRISLTGIGSPTAIRAIHDGSKHQFYTYEGTNWTKRGPDVTLSTSSNNSTGVRRVVVGSFTFTALDAILRRSPAYLALGA